ncbi:MAG: group II truncated hemoglobin [Halioglobus sp.]
MSGAPQTPFQILGEQGIRELCNTFYEVMDTDPELKALRDMHAEDLEPMKGKLAQYLIGWMGGPPLYDDEHGTVCLTDPHEPYHIGPKERDEWLACMDKALIETQASEELIEMLKIPLFRVADAVRNREGPSAAENDSNIIAAG